MPIADVRGLRLHYELEGPDSSSVLALAHSLGTDLCLWDPIVAHLGTTCRVLRLDMRGHGGSTMLPGPSELQELGKDFVALLDELGITRCHFAGISLGGILGLWLAVHAPERIGRLVLANTAARIGEPRYWDERIELVRNQGLAPIAAGSAERWFTREYRSAHAGEVSRVVQRLASSSAEGYIAACVALRDADLTTDLCRIEAQVLVIGGTFDCVTTPQEGRALARSIRRAQYVEMPAAHLAPIECPAEFSREALTFFAAQEDRPRG